jgi:hypothetical protein
MRNENDDHRLADVDFTITEEDPFTQWSIQYSDTGITAYAADDDDQLRQTRFFPWQEEDDWEVRNERRAIGWVKGIIKSTMLLKADRDQTFWPDFGDMLQEGDPGRRKAIRLFLDYLERNGYSTSYRLAREAVDAMKLLFRPRVEIPTLGDLIEAHGNNPEPEDRDDEPVEVFDEDSDESALFPGSSTDEVDDGTSGWRQPDEHCGNDDCSACNIEFGSPKNDETEDIVH